MLLAKFMVSYLFLHFFYEAHFLSNVCEYHTLASVLTELTLDVDVMYMSPVQDFYMVISDLWYKDDFYTSCFQMLCENWCGVFKFP
jgi:hypothetical protein